MDEYDFSPPSTEELKTVESQYDLSPPSAEELKIAEEPSTAIDVLRGAAQGLTFGFSDEALAALKAATEVSATEKTLKDLPSLYRQYQQLEQEKVKEAKERSPIAFGAAEIAGGLAPALFTGGGTAAATAARGFLPAVGKGALTGAKYGALAAAGTAEAPIEETGELAKEIGKGALFGGTLGGALGGIGDIGRKLAPDVEDIASLRQAKTAYEEGKAGRGFTGEKAKSARLVQERDVAVGLEKNILDTRDVLGQKIDDVLLKAEEAGKIIEADPASLNAASDMMTLLESKPKLFGKEEGERIFGMIQKLESDALSPKEANELRRLVKDKLFKVGEKADVETSETLGRFKDALQTKLNDIEGFAKANEDYTQFLRSTAETIFGKGKPVEVLEGYLSEVAKPKEKLFTELQNLLKRSQAPGSRGDAERMTLINLQENLAKMEAERPGYLKSIGFDPEKFLSTIKKEADVSTVRQVLGGYEPQTGTIKEMGGFITPRATMYSAAEKAGRLVGAAKETAPVRLASKVYSAAEPKLRKISDALMQNEATKRFGQNLASSLDKPGGVARRAVLFTILQSPEARKAISGLYPEFGEE